MSELLKKYMEETVATNKAIDQQRKDLNETRELLDTSNKLVVHLSQWMTKISTTMNNVTSTLHSLVQSVNNIAQIMNTNNYHQTLPTIQQTNLLENLPYNHLQTTTQIIENSQDPSNAIDNPIHTNIDPKPNDRTPHKQEKNKK